MKILIVSDTHRRDGNLLEVIEKTAPFDMMIHLGDTEGSEAYFKEHYEVLIPDHALENLIKV